MTASETHVLLLLDLATENPIQAREAEICARIPGGPATIVRLSRYDVEPTPKGTPDDWRPVIASLDRMVKDAREAERGGARCRYWVAGRAGLPAFFHLGHLLTRKARVTLLHPRDDGELDELALDVAIGPRETSEPYFAPPTWPPRSRMDPVRLALVVASSHVPPEHIEQLMSARTDPVAWVVEALAQGDDLLDARSVGPALRQLDQVIAKLQSSYPKCQELAVFLKGPGSLAFLAGRALNPHIFSELQVFQHRNHEYALAYDIRTSLSRRQHTILLLAANPPRTEQLALDLEDREIRSALARGKYRGRFDVQTRRAARPMDLLLEPRDLKPTVIQFSGHGALDGLRFHDERRGTSVVPPRHLGEVLGSLDPAVEIVVLNACYSEAQADELLRHVRCVIGMHGSVGDAAARRFAAGFYGGLAEGTSVARAFAQGRAAFELSGSPAGRAPSARDAEPIDEGEGAPPAPTLHARPGVDLDQMFLAQGAP